MPYELRVTTSDGMGGTTEHVYSDNIGVDEGEGILEGEFRISREVTDTEIRMADMQMHFAAPFLDVTSRDDLPEPLIPGIRRGRGMYRAVLTHTPEGGGDTTVILNGAIPLVDITYEPLQDTFSFPLVAAAAADFWGRLGEWAFSDLTSDDYAALTKVDIEYAYGERTQFGIYSSLRFFYSDYSGSPVPATIPVFELRELMADVLPLAAAAVDLGTITLAQALPDPTYSVDYVDASVDPQTITREITPYIYGMGLYAGGTVTFSNTTLPAWTARMLWEAALTAFGWRLQADYATYPSTNITIRAFPDSLPTSVGSFPDLTDRMAETGYTRGAEPGTTGGFGLQHGGETRPTPTLPTYLKVRPPAIIAGHGVIAVPPPAVANMALDEWTFVKEAKGVQRSGDPEPTAEVVVQSGFTLPMICPPEEEGIFLETDTHTPDAGSHPDYDETVVYGVPLVGPYEREACYLCALHTKEDTSHGMVHARRVLTTRPSSQPMTINETWARELYRLRGASVLPLESAEGEFYVQGLTYTAGNPNAGVALESAAWEIRSEEQQADETNHATLRLVRPYDDEQVDPELPPAPGAVTDLRAQHWRIYDLSAVLESSYTVLSWTPPPVTQPAAYYVVTVTEVGGSGPVVYTAYGPALILTGAAAPLDEEFEAEVIAVSMDEVSGPAVTIEYSTTADDAVNP